MPGPGVCGRTTSAKPASRMAWNAARSGADTWVLSKYAMSQTSSSCGRDVPVAESATGRAGRSASHCAAVVAQRGQPLQLVVHVRVAERAAVGDVDRPDPHPAAGRRRAPAPRRRRVAPGGMPRERRARTSSRPTRESDGHPVPVVEPVVGHLVAEGRSRSNGELVVRRTWSPGSPGRRRRCAAARPRRGRCGSGWS